AGLRRDPPPARRVAGRPPARGEPDARPARGRRLHARPAAAPRGHAHALPPRAPPLLRPARPAHRRRRPRLGPGGDDDPRPPGARAPLHPAYFKRMEAIEFAVRYDDGVAHGLHDADVVLVGVSRTSKTPLSIYLGYLGHKAANVPVVKGIAPPAELFEVEQTRVVGLTIDPN